MKIGIIGAGNIGVTIARKLSACGHLVKLANSKGPETIHELAKDIGVTAVTKEQAVCDVDVVVLSIPFASYSELGELFNGVADDVIVVDTSNYYPARDGSIAEVDEGKPESIWVSERIGRPVVKAWNALLAETLAHKGKPEGLPSRIAIPVAGDDTRAEAVVQELVDQTGFYALASGGLVDSWRQQPGTPAYCTELSLSELKAALLAADKDRAPLDRDALMKEFSSAQGELSHDYIVARNRAVTS
ncbi:NADPH-dependent F420 reductase [Halopseudomonas laoshanensis]|nr:NAD(P)-binding domain-containing protein [Halopseudomonas laoshanensis]